MQVTEHSVLLPWSRRVAHNTNMAVVRNYEMGTTLSVMEFWRGNPKEYVTDCEWRVFIAKGGEVTPLPVAEFSIRHSHVPGTAVIGDD
jgi:hypothetical protein